MEDENVRGSTDTEISGVEESPKTEVGSKTSLKLTKRERLSACIALGLLVVLLVGVMLLTIKTQEIPEPFVTVQKYANYRIVYDRETNVMYNMTDGKYNAGQLYQLYNPDGSLKIYTGNQD